MKRVFVLAFLPMVLFGLEKVNLIKDAGFEKNSEVWETYTGADFGPDSAEVSAYDSERPFSDSFSAYCDTKTYPGNSPNAYTDTAVIIQKFCCTKRVSDLDSFLCHYSSFPINDNNSRYCVAFVDFYLTIAAVQPTIRSYRLKNVEYPETEPQRFLKHIDFPSDTLWYLLAEDVGNDLDSVGIPPETTVDSFRLIGKGRHNTLGDPPFEWYGQKIYWDDIRLMGYADYDVGVKEILSPEVISQGESYTPVARIKNFGREPADSFLVIVEADDGRTDTLPWTLPPDTEDTVTFATWEWPEIPQYFTVRTVMDPDESDADDELLQGITVAGIQDPTLQDNRINLQVISSRDGVLKVSFEIPDQQVGSLTVYDATGRRIERMAVKGSGRVEFGTGLPAGVYLVRLETNQTAVTRKMVMLR